MKYGDTGAEVAELQRALIDLGYGLPRFGADGSFGGETQAALDAWAELDELPGLIVRGDGELPDWIIGAILALAAVRRFEGLVEPVLEGVDVSGWQSRELDWQGAAADGYSFALIKLTQGTSLVSRFPGGVPGDAPVYHFEGSGAAGKQRALWHFADLTTPELRRDPNEQAEHFLRVADEHLGGSRGELVPWLDLEWQRYPGDTRAERRKARTADIGPRSIHFPAEAVEEWSLRWLERVDREWGCVPGVYTDDGFWEHRLGCSRAILERPLWLAEYYRGHPVDGEPPGGSKLPWLGGRQPDIWQWTGAGRVPWYPGKIDRNIAVGNLDALIL